MKKTALLFLIGGNLFLISWLTESISSEVNYRDDIKRKESLIIDKLKYIRRLQTVYRSQKGHYASNWPELIEFGNHGYIYTIETKETAVLNSAGIVSKLDIQKDTLSKTTVCDSVAAKFPYRLETLNSIPGYDDHYFLLNTDIVTVGGVNVEVIEVSCPVLVNNKRRIKFGSMDSPTLAGNWR